MTFSDISLKKLFISVLALSTGAPAVAAAPHTREPRRLGTGHGVDTLDKRAPFQADAPYPETGVSKALRRYAYDHPVSKNKG